ncbi:UdgX family uracil-DNA binding protein [Chelatococcus reniformis]|uniref:Type-4 uracil-DNA glycosylase n=1 Tax=Chelatococcus reniformis TaxID=1494448 RepID=A0A916UIJ8_9HYPH|nr:UdgX family uracil-DNA binding protein [Chelatococcus reniformis]GGC74380.1 uracil-DNA glycosylase [Chelatococcus reniformis]
MASHHVVLSRGADLAGFRRAVRALLAASAVPDDVEWSAEGAGLFGSEALPDGPPVALPRAVGELISHVVCHSDPERYALLFALVWRIQMGERSLLEVASDPLVHRLALMDKAVRRDLHKMHAFLRFRRADEEAGAERFTAWFEPDHFILEAAAPFFVDRFRRMRWSILTPMGSAHWDGSELAFGPSGRRADAPPTDAFEASWRGYYESTFNPARLNPAAMRGEMPRKYWRNMPETAAIPALIRSASSRVEDMLQREAAMPTKRDPQKAVAAMANQDPETLDALNRIIAAAEPFVHGGTRAVLGEGPVGAPLAFVGEQPGDQEDVQGRPFVGPAGQLLDRAMAEAGVDRSRSYVTNAVKHFKFEQRGKRRLHQTPTAGEVKHYRWWLIRELEFVQPRLVVALGATAVLALAGKALPIGRSRGSAQFLDGFAGFITVHPSYLLRLPDEAAKREAYAAFVADLVQIHALAASGDGRTLSAAE